MDFMGFGDGRVPAYLTQGVSDGTKVRTQSPNKPDRLRLSQTKKQAAMVLYIEALTSSLSDHSLYITTGILLLTCVLLLRDE